MTKAGNQMPIVSASVSEAVRDRIDECARKSERSRAWVIRRVLESAVYESDPPGGGDDNR